MHLSWNEIRVRAASFVQEWWNTVRERSETQSFYNDFFEIFGVKRRTVARYEQHVKKLDNSSGFIDLFWPGVLIVEQKSIGRDLTKAYGQAGEYFDALKESERPRYILVSHSPFLFNITSIPAIGPVIHGIFRFFREAGFRGTARPARPVPPAAAPRPPGRRGSFRTGVPARSWPR